MALFKHKLTGEIVERPAHYADHPVFGKKLIPVNSAAAAEAQASKVVVEPEVTTEPLTSAAETEFTEEIEVNIETDKE